MGVLWFGAKGKCKNDDMEKSSISFEREGCVYANHFDLLPMAKYYSLVQSRVVNAASNNPHFCLTSIFYYL